MVIMTGYAVVYVGCIGFLYVSAECPWGDPTFAEHHWAPGCEEGSHPADRDWGGPRYSGAEREDQPGPGTS